MRNAYEYRQALKKAGINDYWDVLVVDEQNPQWANAYYTEGGKRGVDTFYITTDGVVKRALEKMPFDQNGRHATGMEVWTGKRWIDEYDEGGEDE